MWASLLRSKQQGYVGEGAISRGQMQSDGGVDDVVDVQGVDVVDVVLSVAAGGGDRISPAT